MKHRIFHSAGLRDRFPEYARKLGASPDDLSQAYEWMLGHDVAFESPGRPGEGPHTYISSLDIERRIQHPLGRKFYALLRDEMPCRLLPDYGKNWPTFLDRCRRMWELAYNIVINKIPSHHLRLAWLRLGGARIGKGSTIWRHTEVLGMESLTIGEDSCIGWHCQIDARAGLVIGSHVAIASHVLIIGGGHDLDAPEFWSVSAPIRIGDYAWITSRAMLVMGASIGEGAVVSANCVVSKKVEPYTIVAGQGAKAVGTRARGLNYKVGGKGLFTLLH